MDADKAGTGDQLGLGGVSSQKPGPTGWVVSRLDDVADSTGGGTPSKAEASFWTDGTVPWVSPKDMKSFHVASSEDHLTPKALKRLTLIPPESVLVVVRSGILARTLPVALNAMPVTVNQDMRAFVPARGVSARYLALQLIAKEHEILAECSKDGTTVASIDGPALARFPLHLAPESEQTRIVEKLEELLSDLDAGVAELKAAQKKLAQYRQSLLKAAVEGALTAEWRAARKVGAGETAPGVARSTAPRRVPGRGCAKPSPDPVGRAETLSHESHETGAQLLARILSERRARWEARQLAKFKEQGKAPPKDWQKKYPEPVAPDTRDLPELPEGWGWASLGQLLESITSGSRDWAPYYDRGSCVFVMAQNVRPWRADFEFRQFVDPPENDRDRARSEVRQDDLLITIVGANTGQACRVCDHLSSHFVCQSVALLRPLVSSFSEYLNAVLNSEGHGQRQFREMNYGAGRPHLSFDQIEAVNVPLPPDDERQEIVRCIENGLDVVSSIEAQLNFLQKQSAAQRQNILRASFAGQLVPQDPNDEPASTLLERIRAERAALGDAKQPGRRKVKGAK